MNLEDVKSALLSWKQIRNSNIGLSFLTSGFGFTITREEFDLWENVRANKPTGEELSSIHVYVGIYQFETTFFLVDSYTDHIGTDYKIGETLFIKKFTKQNLAADTTSTNVPNLIEINSEQPLDQLEATSRMLRWMVYSDYWFKLKQEESLIDADQGVVRGLTIPYTDIISVFENQTDVVDKTHVFFGLKDFTAVDQTTFTDVELIVGPIKENLSSLEFADVSLPCPPFSLPQNGFNLVAGV